MAPGEDEMELINAEFESMVANLNLDQSSPTTFLDELDAIDESEQEAIYNPDVAKIGFHNSFIAAIAAIKRWWNRGGTEREDGAEL